MCMYNYDVIPIVFDWADLVKKRQVEVFNFNFKPGGHTTTSYVCQTTLWPSFIILYAYCLYVHNVFKTRACQNLPHVKPGSQYNASRMLR